MPSAGISTKMPLKEELLTDITSREKSESRKVEELIRSTAPKQIFRNGVEG
jgi:hypothetical protein